MLYFTFNKYYGQKIQKGQGKIRKQKKSSLFIDRNFLFGEGGDSSLSF